MTASLTEQDVDVRAEYTKGLRALADLLDANPDLKLPYEGSTGELLVILTSEDDQKAALAAWARALPGEKRKDVRGATFDLYGSLHGLRLQVIASRDQVCRKVVTGTREVTKTIPDPSVEVPTVEVTETVETVEWVCEPILGERVAS